MKIYSSLIHWILTIVSPPLTPDLFPQTSLSPRFTDPLFPLQKIAGIQQDKAEVLILILNKATPIGGK